MNKEQAQQEAKEWQIEASEQSISYNELADKQAYFAELASKYGLTKEFKENGIIWKTNKQCLMSDYT